MNKLGQREMSIGTLLAIVLGIVVLVVIILAVTGTFDDIFSKTEALPGNVEAIAQSCKIAVQANLITDYCYNFKKVSDEEYINCEDGRIEDSLMQQNIDTSAITCAPGLVEGVKKEICKTVIAAKKDKVTVEGQTCKDFLDSVSGSADSGGAGSGQEGVDPTSGLTPPVL